MEDFVPEGVCVICIEAPDTGFPDSSTTEPLIIPVVCSARTLFGTISHKEKRSKEKTVKDFEISLNFIRNI